MRRMLRLLGLDDAEHDLPAVDATSPSVIGAGLSIKGELRGAGSVTVLGHFEGDIVLDGTLHVAAGGRVDANISAHAIVIGGLVRGNLSADTRVEILSTGALSGTVKSVSFSAADGASVKGELWVDQPAAAGTRPAKGGVS
jgi:cytoskeletal protein CcmA (bactofilin family)